MSQVRFPDGHTYQTETILSEPYTEDGVSVFYYPRGTIYLIDGERVDKETYERLLKAELEKRQAS